VPQPALAAEEQLALVLSDDAESLRRVA